MGLKGRGRLHGVPLVAGLAVSLVGVLLGNWQVGRAVQKEHLRDHIAAAAEAPAVSLVVARAEEWQAVAVAGEWLPGGAILLDNRLQAGRPGYHALAPLKLEGSGAVVLVNRGWVAAGADRRQLPTVPEAAGPVRLEGVVRRPEAKPFTLAERPGEGRLWQVLDLPAYRQAFGLPVAEVVVFQTSPAPDGLVRDWPRPDAGIDRHRGYAVQWYGLAAAASVMTGVYGLRSVRRKELESL